MKHPAYLYDLVALLLALVVCSCHQAGGNGDAYLGGDDLSTAEQVNDALGDVLADLDEGLRKAGAMVSQDPLAAPTVCNAGDDDCTHLSAIAKSGHHAFTASFLKPELSQLAPKGPVELVDTFPQIQDPYGHPRSALGATHAEDGSPILLNRPGFMKFSPGELRKKMAAIVVHERLHQRTKKHDNEPYGPYTGPQGAQEALADAGMMVARFIYSSGLADLLRGQLPSCTDVTLATVTSTFVNFDTQSAPAAVTVACSDPWIIADSGEQSVGCGASGGASATCAWHPSRGKTPIRPYPLFSGAETKVAFFAEDPVYLGAGSPLFRINTVAACMPPGNSLCLVRSTPGQATVAGTMGVLFKNGAAVSTRKTPLSLPSGCARPTFRVQSYTPTWKCRDASGGIGCPSAPGATDQVILGRAVTDEIPSGLYTFELYAQDPLRVEGTSSPRFDLAYEITCHAN